MSHGLNALVLNGFAIRTFDRLCVLVGFLVHAGLFIVGVPVALSISRAAGKTLWLTLVLVSQVPLFVRAGDLRSPALPVFDQCVVLIFVLGLRGPVCFAGDYIAGFVV